MKIGIWAVGLTAFCWACPATAFSPGQQFPVASGKAAPRLQHVEVQRIASDNTIDLAVVLTPNPAPRSAEDALVQLGEFCLRYESVIADGAVPAKERSKIDLLAPLYVAGAQQTGFAFRVVNGRCVLGSPFPGNLVAKVRAAATAPLN